MCIIMSMTIIIVVITILVRRTIVNTITTLKN